MKQVSVREAQHDLARVLALVEAGEEVEITRRQSVAARIVPATGSSHGARNAKPPDYMARLRENFPEGPLANRPAESEILRGRSRDE
jgi:antitoxin (DNA-binding transcriptional repressor) of toxin-antitoxin stability system